MTVINKLNQTMEMLKSTESNCRTFSMDTDDPNAKQMFNQIAENVKMCENMLQSRINYVMSEEPQYQPEQQQQQIQQQIQMQEQQQQQNQQ
ncbi:DUF1657 domain-containing protein [Clostridium sp. FAM 1755]|uniref:DUF1657 domain-containing protein n=2 Tax=Clostridium TaxID=1485 RepID=A0A6M0T1I6_CLOBO|nr:MULTISPECIES: DUF1657 domain-containing protein [Clostridium]EJP6471711.1 DUF1657 domain-containing protein [Clostridium botulinum]KOR23869.1 hypothetical protein ND00_31460 [Clostridium sp. L74]MDS1002738.1 DUF1657 domain-containing protein [Clostridium sporogenes]NFA61636.1 DUF1657 domain-containing protein [Clostridium botulinum]NFI72408.1 DUF1657 domain-containing protein [Clostridium sporogenes]